MNKVLFSMVAAAGLFAFTSCGGSSATEAKGADSISNATAGSATYKVDAAGSSIGWHGSKLFSSDGHKGTFGIKEGSLSVENGNITAGEFVIDMNSLAVSDLTKETGADKLIGHLKADDFFNTEKYPTAKFVVTKCEAKADGENTHVISGNLTLRDSTKNISFPAKVSMEGNNIMAAGKVSINRLDWGINYGKKDQDLTEAAIKNIKNGVVNKTVDLEISIKGTK